MKLQVLKLPKDEFILVMSEVKNTEIFNYPSWADFRVLSKANAVIALEEEVVIND